MTIILRNDVHNTEARIRLHSIPARLSKDTCRRVRQELCGIPGCVCGDALRCRGPQNVRVETRISAEGDWTATVYAD